MKRHEWEFTYRANQLAEAAKVKFDHHTARLAWWKDKYNQKFEEIKSRGLQVTEHVGAAGGANAMYFASSTAYNHQPVIAIDSGLTNEFNECKNKVNEHSQKVREYDGWFQALSTQGQASYPLLHQDWLFFFGK